MKMELAECSETSAHEIQTPEIHSKKKKDNYFKAPCKTSVCNQFVSMANELLGIGVVVKLCVKVDIVKACVIPQ